MKSKKRYTHLFFDLDNTLWDFENNAFYALKNVFSLYETQFSKIDFQVFFKIYTKNNKFLWDEYHGGKILKKELLQNRFRITFNELSITGIDPLEMNRNYLLEMPRHKKLVDGTVQLLDYLKMKGYRMFIITNGFAVVQKEKMITAGIMKYFNKVFSSEEINSPKPSKEIFSYSMKSANAKKATSLMIGDDFRSDIMGALSYGIDALHLNLHNEDNYKGFLYCKSGVNNLYQVKTMSEIFDIL